MFHCLPQLWRRKYMRVGGLSLLVCALAACEAVETFAQGVGSSGDVRGTITDPSGAVMANVNMAISNVQTGFERTTTTDSSGQYRFGGLPPAGYDLTAHLPGFVTEI